MANQMKTGGHSMTVEPRHGKGGNVVLRVDIPQDLKTDLVFKAEQTGKTLKQICIEALKTYLK